jgi:hypothetical protein
MGADATQNESLQVVCLRADARRRCREGGHSRLSLCETPTGFGSQRSQQRLPHFETLAVACPVFVHVAISAMHAEPIVRLFRSALAIEQKIAFAEQQTPAASPAIQ